MKKTETNPDPTNRVDFGDWLSTRIRRELQDETMSVNEVVFMLARFFPALAEESIATGHLAAAYELAKARGEKPAITSKDLIP